MNFVLPALAALSGVTSVCLLVRARGKPVLVVILGVSLCLALESLIIFPGMIPQKGNSLGTLNNRAVPDTVVKEDRIFLNDLIQQQNQDKAESDSKPAPRAELVVNTSEVRRAQLVVNGRVVERGEIVRPGGH
jgi:hypothetical protein